MEVYNKLVLIGNGFDLAHGLKTSYKSFLDWYMCNSFERFRKDKHYTDSLITISNKYGQNLGMYTDFKRTPSSCEDVVNFLATNDFQSIKYESNFFNNLLKFFKANKWVDIEIEYFSLLKKFFSNPNIN